MTVSRASLGPTFTQNNPTEFGAVILIVDGDPTISPWRLAQHGAPTFVLPSLSEWLDVDSGITYRSDGSEWTPTATGTDFGPAGLLTDLISESTAGVGVEFTGAATGATTFLIKADGTINNATTNYYSIWSSPAVAVTARTAGLLAGFAADLTGNSGDTSGTKSAAFAALAPTTGGGSAVYEVINQGAGYAWTIDSSAAATGEVGWMFGANKATAWYLGTSALTFGVLTSTTATPHMAWTFTATAASTAYTVVGSINHATAAYSAQSAHATQLSTSRTAGQVNAHAASCTSLAGDINSVIYADYDAVAPTDGGGTVIHSAFKVELGHDRALDLTACATGEGLFALADNLAVGAAFREGANAYLTFVTTNSSESVTVGQPLVLANKMISVPAVLQDIAGAGVTITLPTAGTTKRVTAVGGAGTGSILAAGVDGQQVTLFNIGGTNSITMAASGTSHVALGTACVIPALTGKTFTYDGTSSLWYSNGPS